MESGPDMLREPDKSALAARLGSQGGHAPGAGRVAPACVRIRPGRGASPPTAGLDANLHIFCGEA